MEVQKNELQLQVTLLQVRLVFNDKVNVRTYGSFGSGVVINESEWR